LNNNDGCSFDCLLEEGYTCGGTPYTCTSFCGNGWIKTADEACDDGNSTPDDGCTNCQVDLGYFCLGEPSICSSTCGDGIKVNSFDFEFCDDNDTDPSDGCDENCNIEDDYFCEGTNPSVCVKCSNGAKEAFEACDDFDWIDNNGCNSDCKSISNGWTCPNGGGTCNEICGDGLDVGNEYCDD